MTFFDDRNFDSHGGAGGHTDRASSKAQVAVLMKTLLDRLGTFEKVAEKLGLHRATVHRWLNGKAPPTAVDQLMEALALLDAREEMQGQGYTVHGESDEPKPIKLLKRMVIIAVQLRKLGLKIHADDLDQTVIDMVDEIKDSYNHSLEGKFLAVTANCQTGMKNVHAAIKTFDAASEAMRAANNEVEVYRYTMSRAGRANLNTA